MHTQKAPKDEAEEEARDDAEGTKADEDVVELDDNTKIS